MAAPSKFVIGYGLLAKLEASYNAGGALSTSTDGVLLEELAGLTIGYANDGARPAPPGTAGYQKRVKPSGRFGDLTVKVAPKGAGAAYSASVFPNIHALLRASGMDVATVTTPGSESQTYTPTPLPSAGYGSNVISVYGRGQLYPMQGVLGDWSLELVPGQVPLVTFSMKGLMPTAFTDVTLPAITYPALTIDPPKVTALSFQWGGFTPVVRKVTIGLKRSITPRLDVNATGGHAGFAPGRRTPQMEIEIETPAIASLDPFNLFDSGSGGPYTLTVGSVQYNRFTISNGGASSAQIMAPPTEDKDGETSITKLSFQLAPSALNLSDEISWVFN